MLTRGRREGIAHKRSCRLSVGRSRALLLVQLAKKNLQRVRLVVLEDKPVAGVQEASVPSVSQETHVPICVGPKRLRYAGLPPALRPYLQIVCIMGKRGTRAQHVQEGLSVMRSAVVGAEIRHMSPTSSMLSRFSLIYLGGRAWFSRWAGVSARTHVEHQAA